MAHLMYSAANDRPMTIEQLKQLPLPASMGPRHNPYSFGEYASEVVEQLDRYNIAVHDQQYAVRKDGMQMFGVMDITPVEGEFISAKDWKITLGLRGSHDQSLSRGLCLGTSVMVCSNLCFDGDLGTLKTKQTTFIADRLPAMIKDAVSRIPEAAHKIENRFVAYKDTKIKPRQGDAALVELYRRGALAAPQLGRAISEWDLPTYEEHAKHGRSVWRLWNACTEALKPGGANVNMITVADRSARVSRFMDEVAGL